MIPPRIKEVQALDDFFLKITYVNGEEKLYDMKKNLYEEFYKNLKMKEINFSKVYSLF